MKAAESALAPPKAGEPTLAPTKADGPTLADPKADPAPVAPITEKKQPTKSTAKESLSEEQGSKESGAKTSTSEEPAATPAPVSAADRRPAGLGSDAPLFARQSPVLSLETIGPKRIAVGKESTYEVMIHNSGQVAAEQVLVSIDLPDWADVVAAEVSAGAAGSAATDSGQTPAARPFRWKVGRLEAKGREKLSLRIVPRQSKPFELAVKWDCAPVASQNLIEVQEPKLAIQLNGPREVLFGKAELYRLELSNPGTGEAENVVISLLPEGSGDNAPATHRLGALAAGEKKVIEVELTARQVGTLTIKVEAKAEGGLTARLAEKIVVQRPALAVNVEAPPIQYVGVEAAYRILVKNPGTAPTGKVEVVATLPPGAKFVSCTHNGRGTPAQSRVTWTLDNLAAAGETALGLTCTLGSPGLSRLQVACTSEGDLSAQGAAECHVEAIADLKLSLKDPAGPVALGADAVYEVRIQNQGTKAAEGIDVMTYFSQGLEPAAAEGRPHRLGRGQVVFDTISSLPAGEAVVLKVKARADIAGNHIVRTEVNCKPLGTRLVSEETTHFYDSRHGTPPQVVQPAASPSPGGSLRTADRREPTLVSPQHSPATPKTATPTLAPTKKDL